MTNLLPLRVFDRLAQIRLTFLAVAPDFSVDPFDVLILYSWFLGKGKFSQTLSCGRTVLVDTFLFMGMDFESKVLSGNFEWFREPNNEFFFFVPDSAIHSCCFHLLLDFIVV